MLWAVIVLDIIEVIYLRLVPVEIAVAPVAAWAAASVLVIRHLAMGKYDPARPRQWMAWPAYLMILATVRHKCLALSSSSSLDIVALDAHARPITTIPALNRIAAVWLNVVNYLCRYCPARPHTLCTQRVVIQE